MLKYIIGALIVIYSINSSKSAGYTVEDVINLALNSTTGFVFSLSTLESQLLRKMNQLAPGRMKNLQNEATANLALSNYLTFLPISIYGEIKYIQAAVLDKIKKVTPTVPYFNFRIVDAYESLPKKVLVYKLHQLGYFKPSSPFYQKVIPPPATSPSETGLYFSVVDYGIWKQQLELNGCKMHEELTNTASFICPGDSIVPTAVLAFQKLWNCNNPTDEIAENGLYGAEVEARILKSSITGFPIVCSNWDF